MVAVNNSSDEFSTSDLLDLKRWTLPDVSDKSARSKNRGIQQELDSVPQLTVKQIEEMQEQAYAESVKQGHKKGYDLGYQKGQQEGYEAGYKEGQQVVSENAKYFESLLRSLDQPFLQLDNQVETELVALAIAVSKQIIRRELKTDTGQVVAVVREAMQILPAASRKVRLSLHPEDAKLVRDAFALDDATADWTIVEEPLLTRGGCRVDTETSRIDASVEKRLGTVISSILGGEREDDPVS